MPLSDAEQLVVDAVGAGRDELVSLASALVAFDTTARAVGDHDLNSFRLRLDPLAATEGLQPGMTVWLRG